MRYFRVRLGSGNDHFDEGYRKNFIGVDYDVKEDLHPQITENQDETFERLKSVYRQYHPDSSEQSVGQCAGNIWYCCNYIQDEDLVFVRDQEGKFHLSEVAGGYYWNPESELQHQRPIRWTGISISKKDMSKGLSDSMDSPKTCIEIEDHLPELETLIEAEKEKHRRWKANLEPFIAEYAEQFDVIGPQELYKWQAVQHFQEHWNLEADDFPAMLAQSLEKTANLLNTANYFPRGMITGLSENEPETVRTAFRWLFNEEGALEDRITDFRQYAKELTAVYKGTEKADYQDPRAVSIYLTLRYPDRYGFYMQSVFQEATEKLAHPYRPKRGDIDNLRRWQGLLADVREILTQSRHSMLIQRHRARLDDTCHQSDAEMLLAQDILYAMKYHLK
jgi:hypothetical protein